MDLDWASGTTVHTVIGNPIISTTTETAQGTCQLHASQAQLGTPPEDAQYLLAVADPDNLVSAADPSKVASLAVVPDVAMESATASSPSSLTIDYDIDYAAVAQNLDFNVYQSVSAPTAGVPFVPSVTDNLVDTVTLPASDTADLSEGSHTDVTLPLSTPLQTDLTHPYVVVWANPTGANHFTEYDDADAPPRTGSCLGKAQAFFPGSSSSRRKPCLPSTSVPTR